MQVEGVEMLAGYLRPAHGCVTRMQPALLQGDSPSKGGLIPYNILNGIIRYLKDLSVVGWACVPLASW